MNRRFPRWLPAVDLALVAVAWAVVVALRASLPSSWSLPPVEAARVLPTGVVFLVAWAIALAVGGAWGRGAGGPGRAALLATGLGVLATFVAGVEVNRTLVVGHALLATPLLAVARAALPRRPARILVVGPDAARVSAALARDGATVVGGASPADEVVIAGAVGPDRLLEGARLADALGVPLTVDADWLGPRVARSELRELGGWLGVTFRPASDLEPARLAKRAFDLVGAALLLIPAAPLMAVAAAAVRLGDGGPVLFVQPRAGRYGRPFRLWKLRTMGVDAEQRLPELLPRNEIGGPAFKMRDDPRVTRVGRWLRRFSIDELPQLVNVLRGEMSLVGPRPPLPSEVERWERWQVRRLSVRPGMTGLWQVSGRADLPWESWMRLDLEYVDRWSLWLDLRLLARTLPVVLAGRGAR